MAFADAVQSDVATVTPFSFDAFAASDCGDSIPDLFAVASSNAG